MRHAAVRAELVPKGAIVFGPDGKKSILRFPEKFESSRAVLDVTNGMIPPIVTTEVRADFVVGLKRLADQAVYVYRFRWTVEGQGEVGSDCFRFPMWKEGAQKMSPDDSLEISCE